MNEPKSQWLAVDADHGVLSLFPFGMARGFLSARGPKIGVPLGLASEAEAREMVDGLSEDPLIDPARFSYFEVCPKNTVATPEEMEAAGIEPRFAEVFRDDEPTRDLEQLFGP